MGTGKTYAHFAFPLPFSALGGNASARGDWGRRKRLTERYKEECRAAVRDGLWNPPLRPLAGTCKIRYVFYFSDTYTYREDSRGYMRKMKEKTDRFHPHDLDNAIRAMKGAVDVLVEEGILPGDTMAVIQGYEGWTVPNPVNHYVSVTIFEEE